MKQNMSGRGLRRVMYGVLILAGALAGCGAVGPEDTTESAPEAIIAAEGSVGPVWVDTWDWSGTPRRLVIFDGDVTTGSSPSITYKVGATTAEPASSWLRFTRTPDGRLTVTAGSPRTLLRTTATATAHQGVVLTVSGATSGTTTCPSGDLGPFVLDASSACYSPLLDQRVLSRVPVPRLLNGSPPVGTAGASTLAEVYASVYSRHLLLWDTFRYRANLAAPGVNRAQVFTAIRAFLAASGAGSHHTGIEHDYALGDNDEDWTDLGHHAAFLDGHRAYMAEAEDWLRVHGEYTVPFRRLPAWIPTDVPTEFRANTAPSGQVDLRVFTGGGGVPAAIRPGAICTTYVTPLSPIRLGTMRRLGDRASTLTFNTPFGVKMNFNNWHGRVHTYFGGSDGRFRDFPVAANVPLFWVWHTTVDAIWASLQRCYLDDGASL